MHIDHDLLSVWQCAAFQPAHVNMKTVQKEATPQQYAQLSLYLQHTPAMQLHLQPGLKQETNLHLHLQAVPCCKDLAALGTAGLGTGSALRLKKALQ